MSKEQFDIMIPFGPACRPAYHLEKEMLRTGAFPMDWMICTDICKMVELYKNAFYDFFTELEEDKNKSAQHGNRYVLDTRNNVISMHHFKKSIPLKEQLISFQEKMIKRYKRLDKAIKEAGKIALLCNRQNPIEELERTLIEFSTLYPDTDITMINIRSCRDDEVRGATKRTISRGLRIHEWMINDVYQGDNEAMWWIGNEAAWEQILDHYRLTSLSFIELLKTCNKIIIYGAGEGCKRTLKLLRKYDIAVTGIAVTDVSKNPECIGKIKVNELMCYGKDCKVLISIIDEREAEKVRSSLIQKGYDAMVVRLISSNNF